ncbi:hypothetical protein [Acidisphaera sp. S103]|uniref:hypothetical protein n=1 Tax=Acidisphaera sp. S103 TaxID=1747223 RepID=UPI00131BC129|nr:hypothetical protein [Acidisphaera sp. S103]
MDARFWFWLDEPLGEQGVRSLLKRLDAHVRARLAEMGASIAKGHRLVDPKVADCQQPIYLAPPRFLDGMTDPLPGKRHTLIEGSRDAVSLMACRSGLPELEIAGPSAERDVPATEKAAKAPRVRKTLKALHDVIPLAASARLIAAEREALDAAIRGTGSSEYRSACVNLYYRRAALEMAALAIHRGGLPVGTRDLHCTMIAAAYVASLPLGMTAERVRRELRGLLVPVVGDDWIDGEWEVTADASIIGRYLAASHGEKAASGKGLRYTYGKQRLIEEWEPTYDEVVALGLRSLATDADRLAAQRNAARQAVGNKTKDQWLAAARRLAPRVHQLKAEGMSARGIGRELGMPISKILRLLALDAETVTVLAEKGSPEVQMSDPLLGAIAYLVASRGFEMPEEFADALGEPVALITATMTGMGLMPGLPAAA